MIELASHELCFGCAACANVCTHDAISMDYDLEGFQVPTINPQKCVECGLCQKKCPVLKPIEKSNTQKRAYALISNQDRKVSSSGGAFSVFARWTLNQAGVVYGAYMDSNLYTKHIRVTDLEGVAKLRGSKYVQSDIGDTYKLAKIDLQNNKIVLYTGTPCQIAGLYSFLGKRYENQLITIDIVCHGVPSPGYWNAYILKLQKTLCISDAYNISDYHFRNLSTWDYRPSVKLKDTGKWRVLDKEENVFIKAFFCKNIFRESCYKCSYSNMDRIGTFTIADYWGIGTQGVKFKKGVAEGVSLVIDNYHLIDELIPELTKLAYIEERPLDECKRYNHNLNSPSQRPLSRNTAVYDMLDSNVSLLQYGNKYNLLDGYIKHFLNKTLKDVIYKLGLYPIYKTISYKLGKIS